MDTISKVWTVQEVRDWLATFPADAIVTGGEDGGGDYIAVEVEDESCGDSDGIIYTEALDRLPRPMAPIIETPKSPGHKHTWLAEATPETFGNCEFVIWCACGAKAKLLPLGNITDVQEPQPKPISPGPLDMGYANFS